MSMLTYNNSVLTGAIMQTEGKLLAAQLMPVQEMNVGDTSLWKRSYTDRWDDKILKRQRWRVLRKSYSNFQKLAGLPCQGGVLYCSYPHHQHIAECTILRKTGAMSNFCEGRLKSLELFRKEVDKRRHDKNMKWDYSQSHNKRQIHLWKCQLFVRT